MLELSSLNINIPGFKELSLKHLVLDYNGTIAKDGVFKVEIKERLEKLSTILDVHVITSDTFGSVQAQLEDFNLKINVLLSSNHTLEKATYIQSLGAQNCIAIGNGSNDAQMLQEAAISISLIGDEGCSAKAMINSDVVCKEITDALDLLLNQNRLVATLRQ
jgi:soluble P-type ATPase